MTKIIGAGGCLIKEIVNRTGANIRVCSKKDDIHLEEIVVTIDGNKEQKYRGAKAIIEKVELFKHGGPVSPFFLPISQVIYDFFLCRYWRRENI